MAPARKERAEMSKIEWTEKTWNPVVGCRRVSPGCEHCYAEATVHRGMAPQHSASPGRVPARR